MLEKGKKLQDRYRIEEQIGQGGMGSVYLATDERFNSTVAIKETLFTDDQYRKAFSREARLLNSLKHTALPKVSDHFVDGNGQYIVMEYIAGDDLFEMIEKSGEAFPLDDVMIWAEQLLDALEYLHGQKIPIIHRDIKPQNLKLTPRGQIILLDFGLAKGNPTDANHQTAANSIFGYSRNYASLEQIQGTGTDPRSDIYSLAATLYHLLTGKPPADALTRVMMVLNEEPDPLQRADLIHEQVPAELAAQLEEAMALNANVRPQTAAGMRELLSGKRRATVSTRPNTAPQKAAGTNLYTQNTKVLAEGEKPVSDSKQADIKTEILPAASAAVAAAAGSDSVRTRAARPRTRANKNGNTENPTHESPGILAGKNLFMASAGGLLLLFAAVFAIAYLVESNSGTVTSDENPAYQNSLTNVASAPAENPEADATANLSNTNLLTGTDTDFPESGESEKSEPENVFNQTESTKPVADTTKAKAPKQTEPQIAAGKNSDLKTKTRTKSVATSGGINTKDVQINEKGVVTEGVVINEKGIRVKDKLIKPGEPLMTREQYEKLTPEQQREVRKALDLKRQADQRKRRRADRDRLRRGTRRPPPPPRYPPPRP